MNVFGRLEKDSLGRTRQVCSVVEDRQATDGEVQVDANGAGFERSGVEQETTLPESSGLADVGLVL